VEGETETCPCFYRSPFCPQRSKRGSPRGRTMCLELLTPFLPRITSATRLALSPHPKLAKGGNENIPLSVHDEIKWRLGDLCVPLTSRLTSKSFNFKPVLLLQILLASEHENTKSTPFFANVCQSQRTEKVTNRTKRPFFAAGYVSHPFITVARTIDSPFSCTLNCLTKPDANFFI
jgi:hypothetical protein